jgi:hypothetical protein
VCVCVRARARSIGREPFVLTYRRALVPVFYVLCVLVFPDRDLKFNVEGFRKQERLSNLNISVHRPASCHVTVDCLCLNLMENKFNLLAPEFCFLF